MIVSLDELKRVLGIDLADTSEDDNLTRLIQAKTVWVEGETKRRFDTPIPWTDYFEGLTSDIIVLHGHIDDSPAADNPSESLDPTTSVVVSTRPRFNRSSVWDVPLVEGMDWERRGDTLLCLGFSPFGGLWPFQDEIKVDYLNGYVLAPEDIREVILEMAMNQYLMDAATSSGTAGITSEHIGDYSYSRNLSAIATGTGDISQNSLRTLSRYKRMLVG